MILLPLDTDTALFPFTRASGACINSGVNFYTLEVHSDSLGLG